MTTMTPANDIGGQMYQHKKPAKRESSSEEMEESDEDLSLGRAASGGASAPQPPRAPGVGPEFYRFFCLYLTYSAVVDPFLVCFSVLFEFRCLPDHISEIGHSFLRCCM